MKQLKYYLPWIIRLVVFILFTVSAVAKMFPIWQFEKQLVDLGIVDWCYAPYLARLIIACELATGIAILQRHFLKRIIIPCTILLLAAFCIHLIIQMVQYGATKGNCGCFGQLIPMTPLEAFIKNIITIVMLIYLYRHVEEKRRGQNKFINLALIGALSALALFMFFPFAPCKKNSQPPVVIDTTSFQQLSPPSDSTLATTNEPEVTGKPQGVEGTGSVQPPVTAGSTTQGTGKQDTAKVQPPVNVPEKPQLQRVNSRFTPYSLFGGRRIDLNEGKKVICLFAAGCDHCIDEAKEICALVRKGGFPDVYVLFMNEETNLIPEFFAQAGCVFPYQVVEGIPEFWNLLGKGANTPGVFFLNNGNIIKSFEGTDKNKLNTNELMKAIQGN